MESTLSQPPSRAVRWSCGVIQVLAILFMLFDAVAKYAMPAPVADAFARQGMPLAMAPIIATLLLVLTVLYAIPRTAVLGAVLLTGYFGGACACNLRAGFSAFEILFPVIFGAIVWIPIYLGDARVRALLPIRHRF